MKGRRNSTRRLRRMTGSHFIPKKSKNMLEQHVCFNHMNQMLLFSFSYVSLLLDDTTSHTSPLNMANLGLVEVSEAGLVTVVLVRCTQMLQTVLKDIASERSELVVAIGCARGKHRRGV